MASLGINDAVIRGSSNLDYVINDLFGTLKGWKKKVYLKKNNIPRKNDVSYISPNGEEIKSTKQLVKYLKAHLGSLKAGDFCWTSAETPRRSARLNKKLGQHICFEELELLPTKRKKQKVDCNVKNGTLNSSKGPNYRGSSKSNENSMVVVKKEPVDELKMLKALEEPLCNSQKETKLTNEMNKLYKNNNDSQLYNKNLREDKRILQQIPLDIQNVEDFGVKEVIVLPTYTTLSTIHVLKNTHETSKETKIPNTLIEEVESNDKLTTAYEETQIQGGSTKDETIVVEKQSHFDTNIIANKMNLEENSSLKEDKTDKVEDVDIAILNARIASITPPLVRKPEVNIEAKVMHVYNESNIHKDVNVLIVEIIKEEVVDFTVEKPLEEEIIEEQRMDVDILNVDHTTIVQCVNEDFSDTKVIELSKLQGIHALVDDTIMFESKTKS